MEKQKSLIITSTFTSISLGSVPQGGGPCVGFGLCGIGDGADVPVQLQVDSNNSSVLMVIYDSDSISILRKMEPTSFNFFAVFHRAQLLHRINPA